ncbi:MAG: hypothetical protein LUH15_18845 [Tannerellaceae bacterium]|nr:hypothetical protein [Tannerellaceae bacterium]
MGRKKDINIRKQQINDIGAVQLLRLVASVDITIEVETAVFELRSATLFMPPHIVIRPLYQKTLRI